METVSLGDGRTTALGSAGPFTLVVDRPAEAGGAGLGFNGEQLLNLAAAGCISNDLFREAAKRGMKLNRVAVRADASDEAVAARVSPRGRHRRDPELNPRRHRGASRRALSP